MAVRRSMPAGGISCCNCERYSAAPASSSRDQAGWRMMEDLVRDHTAWMSTFSARTSRRGHHGEDPPPHGRRHFNGTSIAQPPSDLSRWTTLLPAGTRAGGGRTPPADRH